jgi:hypothetical protein
MEATNTAVHKLLGKVSGVGVENCIIYDGFEVYAERPDEISLPPASVGFLLGLIFEPEDGGDIFSNVWPSSNYELVPENRKLHINCYIRRDRAATSPPSVLCGPVYEYL